MTDIKLLPLPMTLRHPDDKDVADRVQDYARACVEHNVKIAQYMLDNAHLVINYEMGLRKKAEARADRLEEALRVMVDAITPLHNAHMPIEREMIDDEDVKEAQVAMRIALNALHDHDQEMGR